MPDPTPEQGAAREREPEETVDQRFRRWRATGDRTLRNELIEEHRWVAIHCARRFANRGEPLDDLIQVGPARRVEGGPALRSGSRRVVRQLRHPDGDGRAPPSLPRRDVGAQGATADQGPPCRSRQGRRLPVRRTRATAHAGGARGPSRHQRRGRARSARSRWRLPRRDRSTTPSDDDDNRRESIALRDEDMVLAGADDRMLVRQLLSSLPERERTIVELRFYAGLSQSEIAERVGVSQVHVSRLLRSSLAALQRAAGDQAVVASQPSRIDRVRGHVEHAGRRRGWHRRPGAERHERSASRDPPVARAEPDESRNVTSLASISTVSSACSANRSSSVVTESTPLRSSSPCERQAARTSCRGRPSTRRTDAPLPPPCRP